jgi:hypothetical protein
MSRHHMLSSLLSLLLLLLGPSGCQAVVQFARVNGTITFKPSPAGSAAVFLGNATALSTFATHTRQLFTAGIAARPTVNPLFTAPPQVLSLSVTRARNPSDGGIAVTFTSNLRITAATVLTDLQYLVDIKFGPYFGVMDVIPDYLDNLATSIPAVFGEVTGYFGDITEGRQIADPSTGPTPTRPVASPTRRPVTPTRRPVSPTRRPVTPTRRPVSPTRRPVAAPTARPPTCLPNSNVCGSINSLCCSNRCVNGVCRAATRGLALDDSEENELSQTKKNVRGGV